MFWTLECLKLLHGGSALHLNQWNNDCVCVCSSLELSLKRKVKFLTEIYVCEISDLSCEDLFGGNLALSVSHWDNCNIDWLSVCVWRGWGGGGAISAWVLAHRPVGQGSRWLGEWRMKRGSLEMEIEGWERANSETHRENKREGNLSKGGVGRVSTVLTGAIFMLSAKS